jgi:hypothetical protein
VNSQRAIRCARGEQRTAEWVVREELELCVGKFWSLVGMESFGILKLVAIWSDLELFENGKFVIIKNQDGRN